MTFKNPPMKYRPKARYWIPAGMTRKEDLEYDVKDLKERGFGSIEVVSLLPFGQKAELGYEWGSQAFIDGLKAILATARQEGMTVDIANGPAWPISMPSLTNPNDEGALYELTWGTKTVSEMKENASLPKRRIVHEEAESKLNSIFMYKEIEDHILQKDSYVDLMPFVDGDHLKYDFKDMEDSYRIFAFYEQPACHKVGNYYVIDHLSQKGAAICRNYWLSVIYPQIKEYDDVLEYIFCDSMEYKVSMEWTRGFEAIFKEKKGYDIRPYLTLISTLDTYPKNDPAGYCFEDDVFTRAVKRDYYDVLTSCYVEGHLKPLEAMAKEMNMKLRYQVAYNKPFEMDASVSAVSCPENEALKRPTFDNLKVMAGAVHVMHKPIYSFECSAEFDNAYGQSPEDLMWWIKRGWAGGMNQQVFHGISYRGGYDGPGNDQGFVPNTAWPGFEAFGKMASNYWNRTLDIESEYNMLTAIARMNGILQKTHKVDLAICRHDFINDGKGEDGWHLLKDGMDIIKAGYSYDFVSPSLLKDAVVTDGVLDVDGPAYKGMIIMDGTVLSNEDIKILSRLADDGFPIYVYGSISDDPFYVGDVDHKAVVMELYHKCIRANDFDQLLRRVFRYGIPERCQYLEPQTVISTVVEDEKRKYYFFYNYSMVDYGFYKEINPDKAVFHPDSIYPTIDKEHRFREKTLKLELEEDQYPVWLDYTTGNYYALPYKRDDAGFSLKFRMKKDEAVVITTVTKDEYQKLELDHIHTLVSEKVGEIDSMTLSLYPLVPNTDSRYFVDHTYQTGESMEVKAPFKGNEGLDFDAGKMVYEGDFHVEETGDYRIKIEEMYDWCHVELDGKSHTVWMRDEPSIELYQLEAGSHHIKLTVYTNLRQMLTKEKTKYGIFGKIRIYKY
ncbi:MAG: hypothetical protein J6E46_03870 [Faecalicoccus sp.]|nr:hypothetical protein [Faecalicoccus sp.]